MSERRQHWDDALVTAVRAAAFTCPYEDDQCAPTDAEVFDVIAAVEDRQKAHPSLDRKDRAAFSDLIATFAARAESAEAQIQAVRETCDNFVALRTGNPQVDQVLRAQMLKDADEVRRILGGASWEARTGGNDD